MKTKLSKRNDRKNSEMKLQEEVEKTVSIEYNILDENDRMVGHATSLNTELISVFTVQNLIFTIGRAGLMAF